MINKDIPATIQNNPILGILPDNKTAAERLTQKARLQVVIMLVSGVALGTYAFFQSNPFTWTAFFCALGGQLIIALINVLQTGLKAANNPTYEAIAKLVVQEAVRRLPVVTYTPALVGMQEQINEDLNNALETVFADIKAAKAAA